MSRFISDVKNTPSGHANPSVAVITFCSRPIETISRNIISVRNQTGDFSLFHYLFVHPNDYGAYKKKFESGRIVIKQQDEIDSDYMPRKIALLRQQSLYQVDTDYICFLDDDNIMIENHISSLISLLKATKTDCVHSLRKLIHMSGMPFRGNYYPWHNISKIADKMYQTCIKHRIIRKGSSVCYDGFETEGLVKPLPPIATIDMNEWFFKADFIKNVGFPTVFSNIDKQNLTGEDDLLTRFLLSRGKTIPSTNLPTIVYRIGGMSSFDND